MRIVRRLFGHKEVALVLLMGIAASGFMLDAFLLLMFAVAAVMYVASAEGPK